MSSSSLSGLSWLFLLLGLLVVAIGVALAITSSRRQRETRERELLAQKADAMHESARTRHEGGA